MFASMFEFQLQNKWSDNVHDIERDYIFDLSDLPGNNDQTRKWKWDSDEYLVDFAELVSEEDCALRFLVFQRLYKEVSLVEF